MTASNITCLRRFLILPYLIRKTPGSNVCQFPNGRFDKYRNLQKPVFFPSRFYSSGSDKSSHQRNLGKIIELDYEEIDFELKSKKEKISRKAGGLDYLEETTLKNEENMDGEVLETTNVRKSYEYKFKKLEKKDPILRNAMLNVKSKKQRRKNQEVLLEGKRLIQDALQAGVEPVMIFFSQHSIIESLHLPDGVQLYKALYDDLQFWSDVQTTQGIVGIFREPDVSRNKIDINSIPLTIVCDSVRDPGNMGSILRCAAGVGCQKLILTKGCVDLWEPKVLRSAAGCHFRVPIADSINWEDVSEHLPRDTKIYLADSNYESSDNEELEGERAEEDGGVYEIDKDGNKIYHNETEKSTTFSKNIEGDSLKYDDVCYTDSKNITLIIGGETEGISSHANEFGRQLNGTRIFIPLCGNVESLNTGVALGILTYEIRRQFKLRDKRYVDYDSIYTIRTNPGVYSE